MELCGFNKTFLSDYSSSNNTVIWNDNLTVLDDKVYEICFYNFKNDEFSPNYAINEFIPQIKSCAVYWAFNNVIDAVKDYFTLQTYDPILVIQDLSKIGNNVYCRKDNKIGMIYFRKFQVLKFNDGDIDFKNFKESKAISKIEKLIKKTCKPKIYNRLLLK